MKLPPIPHEIHFANVSLGASASGVAGFYPKADANVTMTLASDTPSLFQILQVETEAAVLEPDGPHGSVMTLEPVETIAGPGPISVSGDEALMVSVSFTCPADTQQSQFFARVVADGPGLPAPVSILVSANVFLGGLSVASLNAPAFLPGQTQDLSFRFSSSFPHDVGFVFALDSTSDASFTAPSLTWTLGSGASVDQPVSVTCPLGTPEGLHSLIFRMKAADGSREYGSVQVALLVTRMVHVYPSLPPAFSVNQGDSFRCALRVTISGSPAQFLITPGAAPAGLSITPWQQSFTVDRAVFLGYEFEIAQNAPLGPMAPVHLFWTAREPEINGDMVFQIDVAQDVANFVLPAPISQNSQSGSNPQPLVCDQAMLSCQPDGNWTFTAHLSNMETMSDVSFLFEGKLDFVDGQGRQFGDTIDGALSAAGDGAASKAGLRILGYPAAGTYVRRGFYAPFTEPAFWQRVKTSTISWRMQPAWSEPMGGNIPDPPDVPDPPAPTFGSTGQP